MITINSVGYENEELREKALQLANKLNYKLDKDATSCLCVTAEKLVLKMPYFTSLSADFCASTWSKRTSEGKRQGLVRACKPSRGIKIIDATAGWGKDAAILAGFGAEVLMIERHPVMASLINDALLHRSEKDKQRMHLSFYEGNATSFLNNLHQEDYPDVIYIDPMHPERIKSALVKKEMQALQQIIGVDKDALQLLELARARVKQRVVVKWPQKNRELLKADASIEGKTVRFDIYFP